VTGFRLACGQSASVYRMVSGHAPAPGPNLL